MVKEYRLSALSPTISQAHHRHLDIHHDDIHSCVEEAHSAGARERKRTTDGLLVASFSPASAQQMASSSLLLDITFSN